LKQIIVEHANPTDIPSILEIKKQSHLYFSNSRPDMYAQSEILYTDNFLYSFFENEDKYISIAKLEELIVGYAFVEIVKVNLPMMTNRKYAYIHDIAVRELYRHNGIGRHILTQIQNESKNIGAETIELAVHLFNTNAISLYKKFGFKARTIRMEKKLEGS